MRTRTWSQRSKQRPNERTPNPIELRLSHETTVSVSASNESAFDPLKSPLVRGWFNGELRPPTEADRKSLRED